MAPQAHITADKGPYQGLVDVCTPIQQLPHNILVTVFTGCKQGRDTVRLAHKHTNSAGRDTHTQTQT